MKIYAESGKTSMKMKYVEICNFDLFWKKQGKERGMKTFLPDSRGTITNRIIADKKAERKELTNVCGYGIIRVGFYSWKCYCGSVGRAADS